MSNCPVTLLSDYDLADPFLAQVKGALASSGVTNVIDLMHGLGVMSASQAAFRWRRAWQWFPAGSIHLALQELAEPAAIWVISCAGQRLCGFTQSFLIDALPAGASYEIRQYELPSDVEPTFMARGALVPLVASLAQGDECVGQLQQVSHGQRDDSPMWDKGLISGTVADIDGFGNIITDIRQFDHQDELKFIQLNRQRISWTSSGNVGSRGYAGLQGNHTESVMLDTIGQPVPKGLWGCDGYLEISLFQGSAAERLGVRVGDKVIARLNEVDETAATRRMS